MRVEFIIDELVLHGFDARDRHHIADAIEAELAARGTEATMSVFGRPDGQSAAGRAAAAGSVSAIARSIVDGILSAIPRRES
jgi:hypothetical protein